MPVEAKRQDLQEIVIQSDNNLCLTTKQIILEIGSPKLGKYRFTDCIRFRIKGNWKKEEGATDMLHITKQSARELITLLQELVEE
jgi:hypothetical protein